MKQGNLLTSQTFHVFVLVAFVATVAVLLPRMIAPAVASIPGIDDLPQDPDDREEAIYEGLVAFLEELEPGKERCYAGEFELLAEQKVSDIFYVLKRTDGTYYLHKYRYHKDGSAEEVTKTKLKIPGAVRRIKIAENGANIIKVNEDISVLFYNKDYYWYHQDTDGAVTLPEKPFIVTDVASQFQGKISSYYYTAKQPRFFLYGDGDENIYFEPTAEDVSTLNRDIITTKMPDCRVSRSE